MYYSSYVLFLVLSLGSPDFKSREEASRRLASLNQMPVQAIQDAANSTDLEVRHRSRLLIREWINRQKWPSIKLLLKEGIIDADEQYQYILCALKEKQGILAGGYGDDENDDFTGEFFASPEEMESEATRNWALSSWFKDKDLKLLNIVLNLK